MALPLIAKLAAAGFGFWALSKKKDTSGPSSPSDPRAVPSPVNPATGQPTPIPLRMATVLASNNPAAIRFEAGRLRQEGYPAQAAELEREAAKLEAPTVGPLPAGSVTSPGLPQKPAAPVVQTPVPAAQQPPPVVVQTPVGPVSVPALPLPAPLPPLPVATPPVVVQTPAGPVSVPSVQLPPLPAPVVVQTPTGPVSVLASKPLPVLGANETLSRTSPGQTKSEKTRLWQDWLAAIGLMQQKDVIGQFGPTTETATKNFQLLANAWLKLQGRPLLKVDGVLGNQTLAVARLAHPPVGTGAQASYFGYLEQPPPMAASPLPGVVPPMPPKAIEPRTALASRLAHNIATTGPGQEDRALVQLFQMQEGLKASGLYNASTAAALATGYGIVPAKPRYWTGTGTRKSKQNYAAKMRELGKCDAQRWEEWEQAASNL